MQPHTGIKNISPSMKVSSRQVDFKDWTYNQDNLSYNESEYTYNGFFGVLFDAPKMGISMFIPRVSIQ